MTITRSAISLAGLVATFCLGGVAAQAAMNDGIHVFTQQVSYEAQPAIPTNLMALGLDLSAPETVAAIPSLRLPAGRSGTNAGDDVIGANN
jgi:hypothetical protein